MGLLKKEISQEFIVVPDNKKNQIVFKWPDVSIRRFSKAIVNADEIALFVNTGQVIGVMPPGRHDVDAQELPFLGAIIDHFTEDKAYRAELYFVGTREYVGNTFGGRIDNVQDPQTGMLVTLRVFGDYSLRVVDPVALLSNLIGTVDVANNEAITLWVADQLLKVMRTDVTRQIVRPGEDRRRERDAEEQHHQPRAAEHRLRVVQKVAARVGALGRRVERIDAHAVAQAVEPQLRHTPLRERGVGDGHGPRLAQVGEGARAVGGFAQAGRPDGHAEERERGEHLGQRRVFGVDAVVVRDQVRPAGGEMRRLVGRRRGGEEIAESEGDESGERRGREGRRRGA